MGLHKAGLFLLHLFNVIQTNPTVLLLRVCLQKPPSVLLINDGVDTNGYKPIADILCSRPFPEVEVVDGDPDEIRGELSLSLWIDPFPILLKDRVSGILTHTKYRVFKNSECSDLAIFVVPGLSYSVLFDRLSLLLIRLWNTAIILIQAIPLNDVTDFTDIPRIRRVASILDDLNRFTIVLRYGQASIPFPAPIPSSCQPFLYRIFRLLPKS